jgi:hypothetical protein
VRRCVLIATLVVGAWLTPPASAHDTTVSVISGAMASPYVQRGDAIWVLADNFFPPAVCHTKPDVYFKDSSGTTWDLGHFAPDFSLDPLGELYAYVGDVPQTAALGKGAVHVTQHCQIGKTSGKQIVSVLDTTGPAPTVTSSAAGDGVSGRPVPLTFTLDSGAGVSIDVEWEFLPGDWRQVAQPVYFRPYMTAGTYTYIWKADASGPVPAGHYRFVIHVRRLDVPPDASSGTTYTSSFYVAEPLGAGTLADGAGASSAARGQIVVADTPRNVLKLFPLFGPEPGPTLPASLLAPTGVSLGPDGFLYVVEAGATKVVRLTTAGEPVSSFTLSVPGSRSSLAAPAPIGVAAGLLYVGDADGALELVTPAGSHLATVPKSIVASPAGIAVAPDGSAWVATLAGIQHIGRSGQSLGQIRFPKPEAGKVGAPAVKTPAAPIPRGLALTSSGTLLLANGAAHDVLVVDPAAPGFTSIGGTVLRNPTGVVSAGYAGDFYVVDADRAYHFRRPE